jgi:hypothetical protein
MGKRMEKACSEIAGICTDGRDEPRTADVLWASICEDAAATGPRMIQCCTDDISASFYMA